MAFDLLHVMRSPWAAQAGMKRVIGSVLSFGKSGGVVRGGRFADYLPDDNTVLNTNTNLTYTTNQFLQRHLHRDCNGGARTDTTPTAAQIVAALPGCQKGDGFSLTVWSDNTSTTGNTITFTPGSGVTLNGKTAASNPLANIAIAVNTYQNFMVYVTNPTVGSEAVTIWALN